MENNFELKYNILLDQYGVVSKERAGLHVLATESAIKIQQLEKENETLKSKISELETDAQIQAVNGSIDLEANENGTE